MQWLVAVERYPKIISMGLCGYQLIEDGRGWSFCVTEVLQYSQPTGVQIFLGLRFLMFKLEQKCLNIRHCTSGFNLKNKNIFNIVLLAHLCKDDWRIYLHSSRGFSHG